MVQTRIVKTGHRLSSRSEGTVPDEFSPLNGMAISIQRAEQFVGVVNAP
jgi:hypothetical protein